MNAASEAAWTPEEAAEATEAEASRKKAKESQVELLMQLPEDDISTMDWDESLYETEYIYDDDDDSFPMSDSFSQHKQMPTISN
jgi:hypothetical protein